jgi:sulfite exporter TauE/SafE
VSGQAVLSILAGVMLVGEGLISAGLVPRPWSTAHACPGAGGLASLLRGGHAASVFAGGVANGLLPCGLVYAYLMLAASAGSMAQGALVMAAFGLGTVPLLLFTGVGGGLLALPARRRLFHVAAWCMIATGGLTLVRGATFLAGTPGETSTCPLCLGTNEEHGDGP